VALIDSVNIGRPTPNPYKPVESTGINKQPQDGPVTVRAPGPKTTGLGSGLVGDHIGDGVHHGGDDQAVYAFAREDLDRWQERLGRPLPNGSFGENLTTRGLDLNESRMGEIWRIGDVVQLQVTYPRLPCATFRGWMQEVGWLKRFTADARPGAYFRVVTPGTIRSGDSIEVVKVPDHDVTIGLAFRALTTEPALLPAFLAAEESLDRSASQQVSKSASQQPSA
jgi:MOSC domain-containing protein YiiM